MRIRLGTLAATGLDGGAAPSDDGDETTTDNELDFRIQDDDATPTGITLSLDTDSAQAGEQSAVAEDVAAAVTVSVTATVDGATTFGEATEVSVTVGDADDSAKSGDDYKAVDVFTLTIPAGAMSVTGSFSFEPEDDALDEPDETVSVTGESGDLTVTGTSLQITDDDLAPGGIALSLDVTSVAENVETAPSIAVTATVSGETRYPAATTVSVTVGDADDSAVSGTDYAAVDTFDIEIAAGAASATKSFTLTPTDDALDEADETITVSGESGDLTVSGASITLTDDDVPELSVSAGAAVTEGTAASFTLEADRAPAADLTVNLDVATSTGFATSGTTGAQTFTFRAGKTSESYTVSTESDSADEADGSVSVSLKAGTRYAVAASDDSASVDVNDDDATSVTLAPTGPIDIAEADGSTEVTITLGRALVAGETVTVPLTVSGATVTTHYTLALKGTGNTGVSLDTTAPHSAQHPAVTLNGAGAQTATLTLTAVANSDRLTRTIAIGYGTNDGANDRRPTSSGLSGGISASGASSVRILDDDAKIGVAAASAAEGSAVVFRVTLPDPAPAGDVTIRYSTADGRGESTDANYQVATSADYTAAAADATLTIDEGDSSGTISIATTADATYEGDHHFTLTLDATDTFNISDTAGSAIGTITDADDTPTFAFAAASTDADEDDGTLTLAVQKTGDTLLDATVSYATTDGTATGGSDFTAIQSTDLVFKAAESSKDISVSLTNDSTDEPTEAFTADLTAGADAKLGSTKSHTVTITDDDATTVTLGAPAGHINENAGTKTLTVTLGRALVGDETLDVPLTFAGTSDFGEDYTLAEPSAVPTGVSYSNLASTDLVANAPTVSFSGVSSAAASATVILTATADTTDEGASESVTVGIGTITDDLDGGTSKSGTASFNINDDDDAPGGITLTVDKSSIAEDDATATVTVTASVTGGTAYATDTRVQVKVGEDADSAEEGTDYADVAGFELTITAMETSAEKTFSLNPTDDDLDEDAERLSVTGTSGDITITPASIAITDNDDAPTLSIDAPSVAEGDADETARLRFTVSLDAASGRTVTVNYAEQSGGTATANTDYEALPPGTLTFNAGDTEKHIDITVTGDDTDEPNETVQVRLSSAANASLTGNATTLDATGTINDDEATPTATLVLTPATIDESGDDNASTVTATLSGASHQDVTLTVAAAPVDPAVTGDYTLSAGKTLTIAAGSKASTGAVTITAVDNTVDAANKTVTVSAAASGGGVADPDDATLTITDDDDAPTGITLAVDKSTIAENAAEASVTVTATVTGGSTYPASKDLTITVGAGTSTAVSDEDYTAVENFTLTLPAGAASATDTFDLEPLDDDVDEDTETIAVTGTDAGGVTVAGASIDLTDNDTRGVAVSAATLAVDEADDPDTPAKEHQATYTVVLDSEPTDDVRIDLAATGGAVVLSAARLDFTPSNWNAAQTVTVTAVDDEIDNPGDARSASISHTLVAGDSDYTGVNVSGVTATVNDDDNAPDGIALTVDTNEVAEDAGKTSITVTATVGGGTRYPADTTVTVTVGESTDSAVSGTDYARVSNFDLVISAGEASVSKAFDLTPTDDAFDEADETISVTGESGSLTVTGTSITLADDDVPELSITAGSAVTEGTAAGFTVNADIAPAADLTVNLDVATSDGFAASNTTGSKTLTFRAGRTSESYTVSTQADTTDEPDGSVAVTLKGGTDYAVASSEDSASVDVNDDDATTVALARASSGGIAENGGKEDLTVTLGRALVAGESVTVPLAVSGATVTTHYTLALKGTGGTGVSLDTAAPHNAQNPAVKIEGAGARTATLTLTAVANNDNDSRTVAIAYGTSARAPSSSGLSGGITTSGSASVPILDDDAMVSVANASAAEGSAVVFTVTLPEVAPSGGVTVGYSTSDGRGNNDDDAHQVATSADYTPAAESAALSIAAGSRSGTVSISTAQDTTYEGDHYFTLNLDSTSHFNLSAAADSAIGTITDAADAPSFAFSTASTDADEDDGTLTLTVEKTGTTLVAATVSYATANGTATGGSDFTAIASTDLDFAVGDASKDITVSVTDDSADESTEAFTVDLTAGAHARLGSTKSHTVNITDNDATTVTLQAPSAAIDENAGSKTITVTLGRALEGDETLDVPLTFSGTATFGDDYTLAAPNSTPTGVSYSNLASTNLATNPPTVSFSGVNGAADSATVILTATSDTTDEGTSESVTVGIGTIDDDLDGGTTSSGTATFNIEDDDDAPGGITLTVDQSTIAEDAATATVKVTATVTGGTAYATAKTLKVKVGASTDTAVEGTDYANVADYDLTINAMQMSAEWTFSLDPTDDTLDEDTERLSVTGTSGDIAVTGASITITDDDAAPTVSVADAAAVNEGNDPNATVNLSFAVTLDAASGKQVTVPYTLGGTAAATDDYTEPNPLSVTIAAGSRSASIDVPVKGDTFDEPNETVTVTLGAPTNATVSATEGAGEASGTITDDDATPTVTLALTPAAINESGAANESTVTASLSGATSQDLTLTVAAAPVSPALAGDFTLSTNKTLTIAAGATASAGAVTLTAVDNSVDAPDKTVTVSAAASGGNGVASPTDVTLTINDDEGTPTVSVADATAVAEGNDPMTTKDMSFALTLSGTSSQAVTVPYTLTGSATGGSDYETPNPLSATIAAGQRSGTIVVKVKGDTADEVDETIDVALGSPTNATVSTVQGAGAASGTITDDDATTVLLARAGSGGIAEAGGKEDLTITLGRALAAGESVTVPLSITGATVTTHYTLALKGTGGTGVSL